MTRRTSKIILRVVIIGGWIVMLAAMLFATGRLSYNFTPVFMLYTVAASVILYVSETNGL